MKCENCKKEKSDVENYQFGIDMYANLCKKCAKEILENPAVKFVLS